MASKRATAQQTIGALLESERDALPLSKEFVQHRDANDKGRPGPLSKFVSAHHRQALLQYLLVHAHIAAGPDFSTARDSRVWSRALEIPREAVSRNWRWLEERKLIKRGRSGRLSKVTLRYDDGRGSAYKHPHDRGDRYLQLPYAFWREEWYRKLDLPSLAVLLIALREPPTFRLAQERVPDWYGISTSTFQKGVQGLVGIELLYRHWEEEIRPLAPEGVTRVNVYRLRRPFERSEEDEE